jgi:hypothetical protein
MKRNNKSPNDNDIKPDLIKERLPEEFIGDKEASLGDFLSQNDRQALAATSKRNYGLFHNKPIGARLVEKLLLFVARGEEDKARQILKRYPELLFNRGNVTDYSMRTFYDISAFQYALWALDTRMQRMIMNVIPKGEAGHALWVELIAQDAALEDVGVSYTLNGETCMKQHHFDFGIIIRPLEYYVNHLEDWYNENPKNWTAIKEAWCRGVGGAQVLVPVNVANEYCHPKRSFYPTPVFNKPAPRVTKFYNYMTKAEMDWWRAPASSPVVLGVDFGIARSGRLRWPGWADSAGHGAHVDVDLSAMTALREARHVDLTQTREILNRGRDQTAGFNMRDFLINCARRPAA